MTDFDTVDYFLDASLVDDPNPYFDHLRSTFILRGLKSLHLEFTPAGDET